MKDNIRIVDYLKYLNERKDYWTEKNSEVKAKYQECKEKYEQKFIPKLLRWKFENSCFGDTSWHGSWTFHDWKVEACEGEIKRCTYLQKTDREYVKMDTDTFSYSAFYAWCDHNNIPY